MKGRKTAKQRTEKQKPRLQMMLLQENGSSLPSLGKGRSQEINRLTASEDGRSRLNGSGRDTASSGGTLTVAVGSVRTAAVGAGAVVASSADLTLLTTAGVGSRVVASRTADGLSVRADGTS
jgi:hypothetical protein